ncbi:MAG: hypothetical protein ACE5HT_00875 [Gemmatimonadales bacterium]
MAIRAFSEDGMPLVGIEVTAVPFDLQQLYDSLTLAAEVARPSFPELMVELESYRKPEEHQLDALGAAWRETRHSVMQLADSLRLVPNGAPGYAAAYSRLRQKYRDLARRAADRDRAFRKQIGDDHELAVRAAAAADRIRAWEKKAFAGLPQIADSASARAGRGWSRNVTDSSGTARMRLSPGKWWFSASYPQRNNPFWEYYWNVPVVLRSIGPTVISLYIGNVGTSWRH